MQIPRKPSTHWFFPALFGLLTTLFAASTRAASPLTEADGVRRVCTLGPHQARARAQRERSRAESDAARVWPNPSLVLEHQQTLEGPTERETVIGASIPLNLSGRRSLLAAAATARGEEVSWKAAAGLFEAALAFREAYVTAVVEARRLDVLTAQQSHIEALAGVIQRLFQAGEASGYDLSRQAVQARAHQTLLEAARARAQAATALLELWTGAEVWLASAALQDLAGGSRVRAELSSGRPGLHPEVRALEAESRTSAILARAARRRWVPDLELFAGYRSIATEAETGRGISAALSVPLTLFDHGQGEAALAGADSSLARATADVVRREHVGQRRAAIVELRVLEATAVSTKQAMAQAAEVQERATKLYVAGEVPLAELFDAYRSVEEAGLAELALAHRAAIVRLTLMRAAGSFFDPTLDRACQLPARSGR